MESEQIKYFKKEHHMLKLITVPLWSSGTWWRYELLSGDLQTRGGEGEDGSQQKGPSTVTVR